MTTYYYDKAAGVMLAVDEGANVRILKPVNEPSVTEFTKAYIDTTYTVTQTAPQFTKGCPECGSTSRHRKDCSKAKKTSAKTSTGKRKRGEPCEECGSISSRHKKECSQASGNDAWAALDNEDKKRGGQMIERQYNQVKTAHNHGMDPTSIAHEMNLTVKETNTAILSKSFEEYSQ
jgi:hypothetical protein